MHPEWRDLEPVLGLSAVWSLQRHHDVDGRGGQSKVSRKACACMRDIRTGQPCITEFQFSFELDGPIGSQRGWRCYCKNRRGASYLVLARTLFGDR